MTAILLANTYKSGGLCVFDDVTMTIGFQSAIASYQTLTTYGHHLTTTFIHGRGFDGGTDYYYNATNFGSLDGRGGEYEDCNDVTRRITSCYFADWPLLGGANDGLMFIVIETTGGTTPDNDDVFERFSVGTTPSIFQRSSRFGTGAINTIGRFWSWKRLRPFGTSGTTTLSMELGV